MIMSTLKPAGLAATLAVLTACGGTSVPLVPVTPTPQIPSAGNRLSLAEVRSIAADIRPGYDAAGITPKRDVPTRGGASYTGYVAGTLEVPGRTTDVAGLMEMGVDFSRNEVGGRVGNFVTSTGKPLDGLLTLRDGRLNRTLNSSQVTIQSDVNGTLTSGAGERIAVDAEIARGGFKGRNGAYAGVPIDGSIVIDNGRTIERGVIDIEGALVRN